MEPGKSRVLIANERKDRLAIVAPIVIGLGHEVIARAIDVVDLATAVVDGHRLLPSQPQAPPRA